MTVGIGACVFVFSCVYAWECIFLCVCIGVSLSLSEYDCVSQS